MVEVARSPRQRWLSFSVGLATSVVLASLPWQAFGNPEGHWEESPSPPPVSCNENLEAGKVCAEWITGDEESESLSCCVDPSALGTGNQESCELPLTRPVSDF